MYRRIVILLLVSTVTACAPTHKVQCYRDSHDIHYSRDGSGDLNIGGCLIIRGSSAVFRFKSYFN